MAETNEYIPPRRTLKKKEVQADAAPPVEVEEYIPPRRSMSNKATTVEDITNDSAPPPRGMEPIDPSIGNRQQEEYIPPTRGTPSPEVSTASKNAPPVHPDYIPPEEQFQNHDGFFLNVLSAFDYPANIARSGIIASSRGEDPLKYMKQAAKRERYTDSLDMLSETTGYDKTPDDIGLYQAEDGTLEPHVYGDPQNVMSGFAADVATDPLTYLTFGVSALAKGLKLATFGKRANRIRKKILPTRKEVLKDTQKMMTSKNVATQAKANELRTKLIKKQEKVGKYDRKAVEVAVRKFSKTQDNINFQQVADRAQDIIRAGQVSAPIMGGVLGAGYPGSDATPQERLQAAGAGALATAGIRTKTFQKGMKESARVASDVLESGVAKVRAGDKFSGMPEARRMATKIYNQTKLVINDVVRGKEVALKDLSAVERVAVHDRMDDLLNIVLERRQLGLKADGMIDDFFENPTREHIKRIEELDQSSYDYIFNKKSKHFDNMTPYDYYTRRLNEKQKASMSSWIAHNERVIKEFNDETGNMLTAIKFHVPNIWKKEELDEMVDILGGAKKVNEKALDGTRARMHPRYSTKRSTLPDDLQMIYMDKLAKGETIKYMDQGVVKQVGPGDFKKHAANPTDELPSILRSKAYDDVYGVYAQRFANKYLTKIELDSLDLIRKYYNTTPDNKIIRGADSLLKGYDQFNNYVKAKLLQAGQAWLKNTSWDNLGKSWVESGIYGLGDGLSAGVKTVTPDAAIDFAGRTISKIPGLKKPLSEILPDVQAGIHKDMNTLINGGVYEVNSVDAKQAAKYGLLTGRVMTALREDHIDNLMYREIDSSSEVAKILDRKTGNPVTDMMSEGLGYGLETKTPSVWEKAQGLPKDAVRGAWDIYWNKMLGTVGKMGSRLEGKARMAMFSRLKKEFKNAGIEDELAAKMSADMTKRTFYDYGDVNFIEKNIMKRVFPFYSFYSKNLPYWLDASVDPKRVGRISTMNHLYTSVGETPTKEDDIGIAEYLLKSAARRIGEEPDGTVKYGYVPSISHFDAFKTLQPDQIGRLFYQYLAPQIKTPLEFAINKDFFQDREFWPSETANGKKTIGAHGYKWIKKEGDPNLLPELLEILGGQPVMQDELGNPYTSDDRTYGIIKVMDPFAPIIGDQFFNLIYSTRGKIESGKETPKEALMNAISPMRTTRMTSDQLDTNAFYRMREQMYEERRKEKVNWQQESDKLKAYGNEGAFKHGEGEEEDVGNPIVNP